MWIAIICLLAVLVMSGAMCISLFRVAVLRERRPRSSDDLSPWAPYAGRMRAGADWYKAQEHETVEQVSYDGLKLRAELIKNGDCSRIVIMMHGFHGAGINDFATQFKLYYDMGFALLVPDQRAHGASEGKYICYGTKERYDCLGWARMMDERFHPDDMYLAGVSMGAATVLFAAGLEPPDCVRGIIADCGFTSPRAEFEYIVSRGHRNPLARPLMGAMHAMIIRIAHFDINESTQCALQKVRVPVLFIHGEADDFVPPFMSAENCKACASPARLETVPGAGHAASALVDEKRVFGLIREFVGKTGASSEAADERRPA